MFFLDESDDDQDDGDVTLTDEERMAVASFAQTVSTSATNLPKAERQIFQALRGHPAHQIRAIINDVRQAPHWWRHNEA